MDPRPLKLLQRAPEAHRAALQALAAEVGRLADASGVELQFEFGKAHVAFIVGCNQFLRLHFRDEHAGQTEWPPAAALEGEPAIAGVFRMFGWTRLPADAAPLPAVALAFEWARTQGAPKLSG